MDGERAPATVTRREAGIGAALAYVSAAGHAAASAEEASTPARVLGTASNSARMDATLRDLAARDLFSGVMMLARGEEILFSDAYGLASREYGMANEIGTQLNLASASKMFTATAIMQLHERGRLDIDDTLDHHLDSTWLDPALASRIRITHLLTHTSGLTDYFSPQFEQVSRTQFRDLDDYKPLVRPATLMFEPGARWSYSNIGFLLLGVIIANTMNESFDTTLRALVLEPAGMTRTAALYLDAVNTGYAQGYYKEPIVPPAGPPPGAPPARLPAFEGFVAMAVRRQNELTPGQYRVRNNIFRHVVKGGPAGGLYSTAPDMLRFCTALTNGALVSRRTVELMQSPKPPAAPHWGYGMMNGDGAWGHGGGFPGISTQVFMYPDGWRSIILSNIDDGAYLAYNALLDLRGG